jgi:hypothetical protein
VTLGWLRQQAAAVALLMLSCAAFSDDLDHQDWAPLDAAVRAQIAARQLPGAVLMFGDAQHVWLRRAWGMRTLEPFTHRRTGAPVSRGHPRTPWANAESERRRDARL